MMGFHGEKKMLGLKFGYCGGRCGDFFLGYCMTLMVGISIKNLEIHILFRHCFRNC